MKPETLKILNEERAARRGALLATNLNSGAQELVLESHLDAAAPLAESYRKAFRQGKSVTVEHGGEAVFLNVFVPPPRLVLIGAVHISQALYPMAAAAGFDVTIVDPRTAFATEERFAPALRRGQDIAIDDLVRHVKEGIVAGRIRVPRE